MSSKTGDPAPSAMPPPAPRRSDAGRLAAILLLFAGACGALSIDIVRTGFGLKGDEATYVAMALSAAHDGDLIYEAEDITRFYQVYEEGPQGIFLKTGAGDRVQYDRLYFGKAYVYSLLAAPFVRLLGLNGMFVLHVLLFAGMIFAAYAFVAARSRPGAALVYVLAFFGVSIVPVHAVFLSSDFFHVAAVTFAYFLWCYKEVAPPRDGPWGAFLRGPASDITAAVILGLITFSKPSHLFLIVPLLALAAHRRRFTHAGAIGIVFAAVTAGGFLSNAAISGELNYQGGNRKIFFDTYPFERPEATFDTLGIEMTTNEVIIDEPSLARSAVMLAQNVGYFAVGRHFGFVPFFFPGVVAVALFLWTRRDRRSWQWLTLGIAAFTAVGLAAYMPYTWSGGGGPPGNRYFLSIYPVLLFLTPPLTSFTPAVAAFAGGTAFIAHVLINPFSAAKEPYLIAERGLLRALPVELTMINDLPVSLDRRRSRITYESEPELMLYLLDHNVHPSSLTEFWVNARRRGDVILRSPQRLEAVTVTITSPIPNRATVSVGGDSATLVLRPRVPAEVTLKPWGVYSLQRWAYVLSVETTAGFTPMLGRPGSVDARFLGAQVQLTPHVDGVVDCRAGPSACPD